MAGRLQFSTASHAQRFEALSSELPYYRILKDRVFEGEYCENKKAVKVSFRSNGFLDELSKYLQRYSYDGLGDPTPIIEDTGLLSEDGYIDRHGVIYLKCNDLTQYGACKNWKIVKPVHVEGLGDCCRITVIVEPVQPACE